MTAAQKTAYLKAKGPVCAHCGHVAYMDHTLGLYRCPNPDCRRVRYDDLWIKVEPKHRYIKEA